MTLVDLASKKDKEILNRINDKIFNFIQGKYLEALTLQDSENVAQALDRFRSRPSVGFSDCLVLEIARKAGHLPLGTFDRNLAKLDDTHRL